MYLLSHVQCIYHLSAVQVAHEVVQESAASKHYALACLGLSMMRRGTASSLGSGIRTATDRGVAEITSRRKNAPDMLAAAAHASKAATLAHLRQSVQQTEVRTAALERQLVTQAEPSASALQERPLSTRPAGQGNMQKGAKKGIETMSSLMACITAQKHAQSRRGHSQHLQAIWPLSVAPTAEQQAAAFAQESRGQAPLQSHSALGPLSHLVPLRLELQSLLQPKETAASAEVQHWQQVAITVKADQSVLALPININQQDSTQQMVVTALQASPNAACLACGGSSGEVIVLILNRGLRLEATITGSAAAIAGIVSCCQVGYVTLGLRLLLAFYA